MSFDVKEPYLKEFLQYMRVYKDASKHTLNMYPIHLRTFFNFTSGNIPTDIRPLKRYTEYLLEEKKDSRSTINARLSALKSYYNFLYNEGIIHVKISPKIAFVKADKPVPKKVMGKKNIYKILDDITNVRDRALFETLYATGVREQELSDLNIEDVDFKNHLVYVIKGKGKKSRVVPISETALDWIKVYLGVRKTGPLFLNVKSKRLGTRGIYNLCYQYFNIPPHDLRHAFATHMLESTGNLKAVSEMLGHHSEQFTEKQYIHFVGSNLSRVYKDRGNMER